MSEWPESQSMDAEELDEQTAISEEREGNSAQRLAGRSNELNQYVQQLLMDNLWKLAANAPIWLINCTQKYAIQQSAPTPSGCIEFPRNSTLEFLFQGRWAKTLLQREILDLTGSSIHVQQN